MQLSKLVFHIIFAEKIILFGILGYLALSSIALTSVNGKSLTTKNSKYISSKIKRLNQSIYSIIRLELKNRY